MPIIHHDTLREFATQCNLALGLPEHTASLIADSLVQADLWGHPSHGVMRLFWYGTRVQSGATNIKADPQPDKPTMAITTMDGQGGPGQLVALRAMDQAIAAAKVHGIGAVTVHSSGHFGTAMYFTQRAALQGCVGFLCTNASPAMAPWGGLEKRLGTNPWSWAAPAGRYPPMMLDIANTAVARGKLYVAEKRGEPIPLGWAMNADGASTTDPTAGIAGTILPMAGHKGYAIATIIDMLSGVLSGSKFGSGVTGPYMPDRESGAGHLALAIDIGTCRPLDDFHADMEALIAELHATPKAPGTDRIYYPGEIEAETEKRLRCDGIDIPDATADELRTKARDIGVTAPF